MAAADVGDPQPPTLPRRARWWSRHHGSYAMDVLAAGSEIATELPSGPDAPRAGAAVRRLRRLLDADAVGLAALDGTQTWSGDRPASAAELVDEVLHTDRRARRADCQALPLRAHEELAGALVVVGPVPAEAAGIAATWIGAALERGMLEASADVAERAELRALRAEISPHFIYNALTTIASFVRSDPDRARELVLDFAEFTRHNLGRHGDYTTLAAEFSVIEAYLALARALLDDRLRVQVRIAPEVLPVAVPFLALQPLVENAVQHGVERAETGGLVQVSGEAQGSECVIAVEDDGPGMDPGRVRDILAGRGAASSLGLVNVDRRLRTVYGSDYGLVIETAVGAGTRVVMRVPRFHPGVVAG